MRILVTGGAGYIGSHTVALLRARGDFVVVLDSLELGHRQTIADTLGIGGGGGVLAAGFAGLLVAGEGVDHAADAGTGRQ